jgi:molecular chaperone GrpE
MSDKSNLPTEDSSTVQADVQGHAPEAEPQAGTTVSADAGSSGLEQLRRERDEHYDRLLRKTAEFDNYRKRVEKERREMAQYAAGDLLEALLPIIDDLERALQSAAGADPEAYRRGVELIYKQLQELLVKRGVKPIEAVGQDFDPRYHQAITAEDAAGRRDGEVIEEVRRGYMHGERLLRPAMVKVAKA